MRIVVLEEIPDDPRLATQWNDIALRTEQPQVFYTYEWAMAVQDAYRQELVPLVFLAYESARLVGVVALARSTQTDDVVFLTATTADYCDFLSEPGLRIDFVDAVLVELKKRAIGKITLTNLPADSRTPDALANVPSNSGFHCHSRRAYICARVAIGPAEARRTLKESIVAKKRLRRNLRELNKAGTVTFQHEHRWEQIDAGFARFSRAHIARFLSTGKASNLIPAERRVFLRELARRLSPRGWVCLSTLSINDVPVAWNYGFQFGGTWFWYQPTVICEPEITEFSPGYCLLANIIEDACENSAFAVVDLGLGAEEYKERFSTETRETLYITLSGSWATHARTVIRSRSAAVAKASPVVERCIRSALRFPGNMRSQIAQLGPITVLQQALRKISPIPSARDEIVFFEGRVPSHDELPFRLRTLDSDLLGAAAIAYAEDPATLAYLMRSAQMYREGEARAFALCNAQQIPVHFCWARNLEYFDLSESAAAALVPLNTTVICECFTPSELDRQIYFQRALAILTSELNAEQTAVLVSCSATDLASVNLFRTCGFTQLFSVHTPPRFRSGKFGRGLPVSRKGEVAGTSVPAA